MVSQFRTIVFAVVFTLGHANGSSIKPLQTDSFDVEFVRNVQYGSATSQAGRELELEMDIYKPINGNTKRHLIILAHGGYFLSGSKENFSEEAEELAKAGFVVASINYRLIDIENSDWASQRACVDAVHDMKAVIRYFVKDSETGDHYGIDPNNIFIGGYSAGAITALHCAYANTMEEVLLMGDEKLLDYAVKNGGLEGKSGNAGYEVKIKGVINIAGSMKSCEFMEPGDPALFSVHGTMDYVVPFNIGTTGETKIETMGSGKIHPYANKIGLKNELIAIDGGNHFAFFDCLDCLERLVKFVSSLP